MTKRKSNLLAVVEIGLTIIYCTTLLFIEAFATPSSQVVQIEDRVEAAGLTENTLSILAETKQDLSLEETADAIDIEVLTSTGEIAEKSITTMATSMQRTNVNRAKMIDSKAKSFVTEKKLKQSDVYVVEPIYDSDGKLFIDSREESMCLDIMTKSNWTEDDFYSVLNEEMHNLVPVALRLEEEVGINALYVIAVGASETGWGEHMAGKFNYSNWTNDAIDHFDFDSLEKFSDFSVKTYSNNYANAEFYTEKLGFTPEHITLEVINVKYALNPDKTTNWNWSNVVAEIMSILCHRRNA